MIAEEPRIEDPATCGDKVGAIIAAFLADRSAFLARQCDDGVARDPRGRIVPQRGGVTTPILSTARLVR